MNDKPTTSTGPMRVRVESIDKEMSGLWRGAVGGRVAGADTPMARVLLSNVLIYAATRDQADSIMNSVADAIADNPARVIVADAEEREPEGDVDISIVCSISERGKRLCGEQIRLHTGEMGGRLLGMVMPMLVADLPVNFLTPGDLVWGQDPLRGLTHIADNWIIDSRNFTLWSERFKLVENLWAERQPPIALHDLAWVSLGPWRESVAQHFDPQPARDYLPGISAIEIVYKPTVESRPCIESILMAAWLVNRLGLSRPEATREAGNGWTILTTLGERKVPVRLRPSARDLPVEEVVIECEVQGRRAIFRSARASRPDELVMQSNAPNLPEVKRTTVLGPRSIHSEISQVLNAPGRDRLYELLLANVQDLARQIEN